LDPRRRARLILIVGVLLALVAGALTFFAVSGAQQAQPPPVIPTVDVLVAARDIPARTALTAADVKIAKVNVDAAPPAAICCWTSFTARIVVPFFLRPRTGPSAPLRVNSPQRIGRGGGIRLSRAKSRETPN